MIDLVSRTHKALADPTRLRIVHLLARVGELCVCDVETALDITQSKASRHMSTLKAAGLVSDRRDGTWVYYEIPDDLDPYQQQTVSSLIEAVSGTDQLERDVSRVEELRRSPRCGTTSGG